MAWTGLSCPDSKKVAVSHHDQFGDDVDTDKPAQRLKDSIVVSHYLSSSSNGSLAGPGSDVSIWMAVVCLRRSPVGSLASYRTSRTADQHNCSLRSRRSGE